VARICRRLDGLPLAIELAAARCDLLSVDELASRLTAALPLLTGGARDAPARQRTLRATVDWSHKLLTTDERRTFAMMAVFAGGATVTAAETVTGAALDTLDSLVAKQLLRRGAQRLHMLETVHEYALERLAEQPAGDGAWRRLAEWCRDLAREALASLSGTDRVRTLAWLDAELPNALSALEAALDRGRLDVGVDLVEAWSHYLWLGLRREQGLRWIDAVLAFAGDPAPELLACARAGRGPAHHRPPVATIRTC